MSNKYGLVVNNYPMTGLHETRKEAYAMAVEIALDHVERGLEYNIKIFSEEGDILE
jgi:hypothetical protein